MDIEFLKQLAKENPSLARLINLSIISWLVYALWAIVNGNLFDAQALAQAMLVPILWYLDKLKRDLTKQ